MRFYAELLFHQEAHGYKPGWAAHKFKGKFGSFPPWAWNDSQRIEPSPITERWIRSRNIAYARATQSFSYGGSKEVVVEKIIRRGSVQHETTQ
jgi:hypothetical protein